MLRISLDSLSVSEDIQLQTQIEYVIVLAVIHALDPTFKVASEQ